MKLEKMSNEELHNLYSSLHAISRATPWRTKLVERTAQLERREQFWLVKAKGRNRLEDPSVPGRVILRLGYIEIG
jgi:hypothetical protein